MSIRGRFYQPDLSADLQRILRDNRMQAHITEAPDGLELVVKSPESHYIHYKITQDEAEAMMGWGSLSSQRKAYDTFVSKVKADFDVPRSFTDAINRRSGVNMGQEGYRLGRGEYGIPVHPYFGRPHPILAGMFTHHPFPFPGAGYGMRRIQGRLFFTDAPFIAERPFGRRYGGELQSGAGGFYYKGDQRQGTHDLSADVGTVRKTEPKPRPQGKSIPLRQVTSYPSRFSVTDFKSCLASHGLVINEDKMTLTVQSSKVAEDLEYDLTPDQLGKILNEKLPYATVRKDNKGKVVEKVNHNTDGVPIDTRIKIINDVIKDDFKDGVTIAQLNNKEYVNIELSDEGRTKVEGQKEKPAAAITIEAPREVYRTGFIDRNNSIGVVDGRSLEGYRGFYLPDKDGRRVSVGEIWAYATDNGGHNMTAVINGKVVSHEISADDYIRFLNYDDRHRLELFDKTFGEVSIRSARHGGYEDPYTSGKLSEANDVTLLKGDYYLAGEKYAAKIESAMMWKDSVSGSYVLAVKDSADNGLHTKALTDAEYHSFINAATDADRVKMIPSLLSMKDLAGNAVTVFPAPTEDSGHELTFEEARNFNLRLASVVNGIIDPQHVEHLSDEQVKKIVEEHNAKLDQEKASPFLPEEALGKLRENARILLKGDAQVDGARLENINDSKEWVRGGKHGRATQVDDISVEHLRDTEGAVIDGKYKMTAVIDGNVITHEIDQKTYDQFLVKNDYARMQLFDKVFPEVKMHSKPGTGVNLGAAILAAVVGVTEGASLVYDASHLPRGPRPSPEIYVSGYKNVNLPGAGEMAAAMYNETRQQSEAERQGRGLGI